jgi:phosphoribosylaminoimidazolecarboxamide formyltransferase/IMP cyclohydrolase
MRALVSVSDKKGVVELAQALVARSVSVVSTGGTAKALREAKLPVMDVSELTGSPEIMDGRVKTLHPRVHGGILMRDLASDRADLDRIGGAPIDLVVVNLYPFEATVARGAPHDEVIENIDIGGPCMIRAAAKNHGRVMVVVDPSDYPRVLAAIDTPNAPSVPALRAELARKAFAHTAAYDRAITAYLEKQS